jgi:putative membrane protein
MEFVRLTLGGFDDFLVYFATSLFLVALFLVIYLRVTPYREIALIREGNAAAAASLSGALLGFVLPLASAVAHSVNLLDMAIWGAIALVVQIAAYGVARLVIPGFARGIPAGNVAEGVFVGALSLGIGILNAASMTY